MLSVCCAILCCRTCILRGSSQQLSSLMWPLWGSWSLKLLQTIEPSSLGLKVKVCLFTQLYMCLHLYRQLFHMSQNMQLTQVIYICGCRFYYVHVWSDMRMCSHCSWTKWMGDCTAGLHQWAPKAHCHKPRLSPRLSGLLGAKRVTLQTLHSCCLR